MTDFERSSLYSNRILMERLTTSGASTFFDRVHARTRRSRQEYSWCRLWLAELLESVMFEKVMGMVVVFNVVLLIMDTNASAKCITETRQRCEIQSWISYFNYALLGIYTIELLLRMFAYRMATFSCRWNV